jgi:hypothetical protein
MGQGPWEDFKAASHFRCKADLRAPPADLGNIYPPECKGDQFPMDATHCPSSATKQKAVPPTTCLLMHNKKKNLITLCILMLNSAWIVFSMNSTPANRAHSPFHCRFGGGSCINFDTFHPKNTGAGYKHRTAGDALSQHQLVPQLVAHNNYNFDIKATE